MPHSKAGSRLKMWGTASWSQHVHSGQPTSLFQAHLCVCIAKLLIIEDEYDQLNKRPEGVIKTQNRMVVTKDWGQGKKGELLFDAYGFRFAR